MNSLLHFILPPFPCPPQRLPSSNVDSYNFLFETSLPHYTSDFIRQLLQSFLLCTTLHLFVCLFVLQPNAKPSPAEMSLIEDRPPEPSSEIPKLCTSIHREYKVRQHESCLFACSYAAFSRHLTKIGYYFIQY